MSSNSAKTVLAVLICFTLIFMPGNPLGASDRYKDCEILGNCPPPPRTDTDNRYGTFAICYDNNKRIYWGLSSGHKTQKESERWAKTNCRQHAGISKYKKNERAYTIKNAYSVIVFFGNRGWAGGWGYNVRQAASEAKASAMSKYGAKRGMWITVVWMNTKLPVNGYWMNWEASAMIKGSRHIPAWGTYREQL